jgi:hypothetical protein
VSLNTETRARYTGINQADIANQLNIGPSRSLEATMSYYLVERIKAQPNIEVLTRS